MENYRLVILTTLAVPVLNIGIVNRNCERIRDSIVLIKLHKSIRRDASNRKKKKKKKEMKRTNPKNHSVRNKPEATRKRARGNKRFHLVCVHG